MRFKNGVQIRGARPEILAALPVIESVFSSVPAECVVTSMVDGSHSRGSLHYVGAAVDIRSRDLEDMVKETVRQRLQDSLTDEFDVVLESTHFHIEFQPKQGLNLVE